MSVDAYEDLIAPLEARMIRTITRLVRDPDDAADTMQVVLASVWENLERIKRHPNPPAYIMRMCVSKAYDTLRRNTRKRALEISIEEVLHADGAKPGETHGGDCPEGQEELAQGVMAAIARLPSQQGQAVLLRLVNECSFQEIAETLNCAEATAYSHYSKGKARLREMFTKNPSRKEKAK